MDEENDCKCMEPYTKFPGYLLGEIFVCGLCGSWYDIEDLEEHITEAEERNGE